MATQGENASSSGQTPGSVPSSDNQASLMGIIANYMKKKGYTKVIDAMSAETGIPIEKLAVQMDLTSEMNIRQSIQNWAASEKFAATYDHSYSELSEWIDNSLEQFKPELSSILYPLFVHCYLDLVQKNQTLFASQFLEKHLQDHQHQDGVYSLISVQNADQMKENEVVKLWTQNKYKVSMSAFSFDLLMSFLQDHNFMLFVAMINEHIEIKTFSGYPQLDVELNPVLDKITEKERRESEQKTVQWGVFDDLKKWYEKPDDADEAENEQNDAMETDEETQTKKRKRDVAAKKKAAAAARKAAEDKGETSNRIPIQSELGIETEKEILNDLKLRANLAYDALPSIAFYTVFNTHDNLTCTRVSKDASLISAGFGDSTIKMWDIMADQHQPGQPQSRWQASQQKFMDSDSRDPRYKKNAGPYSELVGHSQAIMSLDFAPDSSHLLSGSADGTVRLWSMQTKTNVVCYRGHNFPIWQTKFAPLGYYFATASHDRTARLWVTSNVHAMRIFAGHSGDVNTVAFHPNYYYLVTGSSDKSLRLWEIHTGDCMRIFLGHNSAIYDSQVHPEGKYAVSAGEDTQVLIWDLASGKKAAALRGHTGPVWSLDISGDGNILASGSSDKTVRLWDLRMLADADKNVDQTPAPTSALIASGALEASKKSKAALGVYPTKNTPVTNVSFTRRNLLTASGPFKHPEQQNN